MTKSYKESAKDLMDRITRTGPNQTPDSVGSDTVLKAGERLESANLYFGKGNTVKYAAEIDEARRKLEAVLAAGEVPNEHLKQYEKVVATIKHGMSPAEIKSAILQLDDMFEDKY